VRLAVEQLEDRMVPVVGSVYELPALAAGTSYDGVVRIQNLSTPAITASGALLSDGRHILTAAHVLAGSERLAMSYPSVEDVQFFLTRTDMPDGNPIFKTISIIARPASQTFDFNYQPAFPAANDIGMITLTDQAPGMAIPSRQMIAPYYGPQIGYDLYNVAGGEIGEAFDVVGYGSGGTGRTGSVQDPAMNIIKRKGANLFDKDAAIMNNEVQTVGLTGDPVGGDFARRANFQPRISRITRMKRGRRAAHPCDP
jgi:hypothetical protein